LGRADAVSLAVAAEAAEALGASPGIADVVGGVTLDGAGDGTSALAAVESAGAAGAIADGASAGAALPP
jgi:hypothetical protein